MIVGVLGLAFDWGAEKSTKQTEHFRGLPIGETPVHVVVRDETQGTEVVNRRMSVDGFLAGFRYRPSGTSLDLARTYSITVSVDVVDRIVTCLHTSICADGALGPPTTTRHATDHDRRVVRGLLGGNVRGRPRDRPSWRYVVD